MNDVDWEKIYNNNRREEVEPKTIEVSRYTFDGKPTCMAWYGLGGYKRMACQFLMTSHFGTKYNCGITGDTILDSIPSKKCPVWERIRGE